MTTVETTPFGRGLRHWRRVRGVSQLELAAVAGTTTRHLSFLETGRSRPSRMMVERLGEALRVPLRERNNLLEMAGLARSYPQGDLAADDLAPFRRAIDRLLASHEPYPGLVLDRGWNIIGGNRGLEAFVAGVAERNIVRLALAAWRPRIDNWREVTMALRDRVSADLMRYPDDPDLQALLDEIRAALGAAATQEGRPWGRVICPRFLIGDQLVRTITVAARFESAADVTLDEMRVELIYPEDEAADDFFHRAGGGHPASKSQAVDSERKAGAPPPS
ncbi:MAG: helix-turn-helix domain-containing protein [Thermoleophilia bacterium]